MILQDFNTVNKASDWLETNTISRECDQPCDAARVQYRRARGNVSFSNITEVRPVTVVTTQFSIIFKLPRRKTQEGPPQDHMAADGREGNQGDGEDLGRHQVYGKGLTDVERACCCPTCHLGV